MSDIRQTIRSFIEQNFLLTPDMKLGDTDSLLELHVVDSTGFLEIVHFVESSYGMEVADHEIVPENLETIDNIVQFVGRKLAA